MYVYVHTHINHKGVEPSVGTGSPGAGVSGSNRPRRVLGPELGCSDWAVRALK